MCIAAVREVGGGAWAVAGAVSEFEGVSEGDASGAAGAGVGVVSWARVFYADSNVVDGNIVYYQAADSSIIKNTHVSIQEETLINRSWTLIHRY